MRIARITMNGPGSSNPIPVNYLQPTFNVTLGVFPSAALVTAATLACSAQYTIDDQSIKRQIQWSQSGTTVTITDGIQPFGMGASNLATQQNPHGLVTGDTVSIEGTGSGTLGTGGAAIAFDGTYTATVTSPTVYTITVTPTQTASGDARVIPQRWVTTTQVPLLTAARLITLIQQPFTAVRFVVAAMSVPSCDFLVLQGLD